LKSTRASVQISRAMPRAAAPHRSVPKAGTPEPDVDGHAHLRKHIPLTRHPYSRRCVEFSPSRLAACSYSGNWTPSSHMRGLQEARSPPNAPRCPSMRIRRVRRSDQYRRSRRRRQEKCFRLHRLDGRIHDPQAQLCYRVTTHALACVRAALRGVSGQQIC
jgi:hypothetical protein